MAFATAGKCEGLQIWRVENMTPVLIEDTALHGNFLEGCSYICLRTRSGPPAGLPEFAIHFWLGAETTPNESGAAAFRSVELDAALPGPTAQYREVQGHESDLFVSYFRRGLHYVPGTSYSADEASVPRLLRIEGRHAVRVTQVEVRCSSLNHDECFVLDSSAHVFVWTGDRATPPSRTKALEVSAWLVAQHSSPPQISVLCEPGIDAAAFWSNLAGQPSDIRKSAPSVEIRAALAEPALYRVADTTGELTIQAIERQQGALLRAMLKSSDVFVLDTGATVMVWIGKDCSSLEKKSGMQTAAEFLSRAGHPFWTPVARMIEGAETPPFCAVFADLSHSSRSAAKVAEHAALDDGTGQLQIWRVENFALAELPPTEHGNFRAIDSYVICYHFCQADGRSEHVIYSWRGNDSGPDERGAAAILAQHMKDALGGSAMLGSIAMAYEPPHLRKLLPADWAVHLASGESLSESLGMLDGHARLFVAAVDVRSAAELELLEIFDFSQDDLNEDSLMLLDAAGQAFVWIGAAVAEDRARSALELAQRYHASLGGLGDTVASSRPALCVVQGHEPDVFTAHFESWNRDNRTTSAQRYSAALGALMRSSGKSAARPIASASKTEPLADKAVPGAAGGGFAKLKSTGKAPWQTEADAALPASPAAPTEPRPRAQSLNVPSSTSSAASPDGTPTFKSLRKTGMAEALMSKEQETLSYAETTTPDTSIERRGSGTPGAPQFRPAAAEPEPRPMLRPASERRSSGGVPAAADAEPAFTIPKLKKVTSTSSETAMSGLEPTAKSDSERGVLPFAVKLKRTGTVEKLVQKDEETLGFATRARAQSEIITPVSSRPPAIAPAPSAPVASVPAAAAPAASAATAAPSTPTKVVARPADNSRSWVPHTPPDLSAEDQAINNAFATARMRTPNEPPSPSSSGAGNSEEGSARPQRTLQRVSSRDATANRASGTFNAVLNGAGGEPLPPPLIDDHSSGSSTPKSSGASSYTSLERAAAVVAASNSDTAWKTAATDSPAPKPSQITTAPRLRENVAMPPAPPGGWSAPVAKTKVAPRSDKLELTGEVVGEKHRTTAFVEGDPAGRGMYAIRHGDKLGDQFAGLQNMKLLDPKTTKLPYAAVRKDKGTSSIEQHIDVSRREEYLKPDEFQQLFGMSQQEFVELPTWHKSDLKKKLGLF